MYKPLIIIFSLANLLFAAFWALSFVRLKELRLFGLLFSLGLLALIITRFLSFSVFYDDTFKSPPGAYLWVELVISTVLAAGIVILDKTLIKSLGSERSISDSEIKFKALFENSSDEIYVIDFEENFLEVNKVICDVLGYSRDEMLRMQVKDIKPDKYGDIVESLLEKLNKEGLLVFESEHISKDGRKIPVEIKSRIIDYGSSRAILSIARDISERKQLERKILNAILETEEKERERFAKDLHDGLGSLLSSIEIYINILRSGKAEKKEQQNMLEYMKALTSEASQNVREISNNLRPSVISRFGLIAAINSLCEKLNKAGVVDVSLVTGNFADKDLNKDIEVTIYRVVNELINNTLKHASAKKISIRFSKENEEILIVYSDDGVGFNFQETMKSDSNKGMGLANIFTRVSAINGSCRYSNSPQGGTEVLIKFKI